MPYNLNPFQALEQLELEAGDLRIPTLEGIEPQTIYELGFATAVKHLRDLISEDPLEIDVITVQLPAGEHFGPVRLEMEDEGDQLGSVTVSSLLPTITEKKNSEDDNA